MTDLSANEWQRVGWYVKDETERRANDPRRVYLEKVWKEIDRQLLMMPKERVVEGSPRSSQKAQQDWLPNIEMPSQFNALEVIMADARRMMFPKGRDWFSVNSHLSDEYLKRFKDRRGKYPIIGEVPLPAEIDQQTADTMVKSVIDHYHDLYDFRAMFDLLLGEAVKYGTYVGAVRLVTHPKSALEARGLPGMAVRGPALVPYSIKNTYLDDTPTALMHEGVKIGPALSRRTWRRLDDIKKAVEAGGAGRGWRTEALEGLEPIEGEQDPLRGHVEIIVWEGDFLCEGIYIPNTRLWVAVGKNDKRVIREESNAGLEHVTGRYIQDAMDSPYGSSPLMKGRPVQEALTEAVNRLGAAACLSAEPPVVYDRYDTALAAAGGPDIAPGSKIGTESVDSIKDLDIGDLQGIAGAVALFKKFHEEVTGVDDPRRGEQTKSHTTATAKDIEAARGQMRTENFVVDQQQGPMTAVLYREWKLIKDVMTEPQPIAVNSNGIEGWLNVASADLPDRVRLDVHGALGPVEEREKSAQKLQAFQMLFQIDAMAAQLGLQRPEIKLAQIYKDILNEGGVNDLDRFIGEAKQAPPMPMEAMGSAPKLAAVA